MREGALSTDYRARGSSISRREWLIASVIAAVVSLLMVTPYLVGHLSAAEDTVFTGILINVEDGTYLSAIEQGRQGNWTYRVLFTTEPHPPVYLEGFYLALGFMARWLNMSSVAMWHLALLVVDIFLFLMVYVFISLFLDTPRRRQTAYLLAIFGSGFDWLRFSPAFERAGTLNAVPVDLRMPEAHLFYTALTFPHFAMGVALILLSFWLVVRIFNGDAKRKRDWMLASLAGGANLAVSIVFPFLIYLVAAVLGVYSLYFVWEKRRVLWRQGFLLAVTFVIPAPLLLYYAVTLNKHEVFQVWNEQATTLSPNPLHYLLAYAPYLLLGALSFRRVRSLPEDRRLLDSFPWIWLVVAAILLYMPLNPQRRFVEGLQVPLAILATNGLFSVLLPWLMSKGFFTRLLQRPRYSIHRLQNLITLGIVMSVSVISIYLYLGAMLTLGALQPYPLFRPAAEVEAMKWLGQSTAPNDVVLGSYWSGSYIPSQSGNVVFAGNLFETSYFFDKVEAIEMFFASSTSNHWRVEFLEKYQIAYVFAGRSERQLGAFDLAQAPYLEPVFDNVEVTIYQVNVETD